MIIRRLAPALAVLAVLALGGTAFAGTEFVKHYLITSTNQIKPSVLKQLQGHAGRSGAAGTGAGSGTAGSQGPAGPVGSPGPAGSPGAPATALWAVVSETGSQVKGLTASSGVTSFLSSYPGASASYELVFSRNVRQCAKVATLSGALYERGATLPGVVSIAAAGSGNPDAIEVFTYEASGASSYRSFSVAVFC